MAGSVLSLTGKVVLVDGLLDAVMAEFGLQHGEVIEDLLFFKRFDAGRACVKEEIHRLVAPRSVKGR